MIGIVLYWKKLAMYRYNERLNCIGKCNFIIYNRLYWIVHIWDYSSCHDRIFIMNGKGSLQWKSSSCRYQQQTV